jgi:serine/threonine protein kinase
VVEFELTSAENEPNLKRNIMEVRINYYFYIPPKMKDLIKQCLMFSAKDRPTIQQVKDHAWMRSHEATHSGKGE